MRMVLLVLPRTVEKVFIGVRWRAQPEAPARLQNEPGQERRWEGKSRQGRREEEREGGEGKPTKLAKNQETQSRAKRA